MKAALQAAIPLALSILGCGPGVTDPDGDSSALCQESRLLVVPIIYIPADYALAENEVSRAVDLVDQHLELGRSHYRALLTTDSFGFAPAKVFRSPLTMDDYNAAAAPDSAHLMARALLDWMNEDRNSSCHIFLTLFARPPSLPCDASTPCLGAGRTFNGYPGSGGGIVQLEMSSLFDDSPYPFQSTLVHELGHAFGLTHVDCYGADMASSDSIMSYNTAHWSDGLSQSASPGTLLPEEYALLDQNALAFPDFAFDAGRHNPGGRALVGVDGTCELGAMDAAIGEMARAGYELFIDGELASGPEAQFYTRGQARESCDWNVEQQPASLEVECLFDGEHIGGRG